MRDGYFLKKLRKMLKRVALTIAQIAINALKAIGKFVGIKPSVGFVGPVPSLTFQIEAEVQAVSLTEFIDTLVDNLQLTA